MKKKLYTIYNQYFKTFNQTQFPHIIYKPWATTPSSLSHKSSPPNFHCIYSSHYYALSASSSTRVPYSWMKDCASGSQHYYYSTPHSWRTGALNKARFPSKTHTLLEITRAKGALNIKRVWLNVFKCILCGYGVDSWCWFERKKKSILLKMNLWKTVKQ